MRLGKDGGSELGWVHLLSRVTGTFNNNSGYVRFGRRNDNPASLPLPTALDRNHALRVTINAPRLSYIVAMRNMYIDSLSRTSTKPIAGRGVAMQASNGDSNIKCFNCKQIGHTANTKLVTVVA